MKRAVILQHVPFEGPGRLAPLLAELGYELDVRLLFKGAEVPEAIAAPDILLVLGGPMGVADADIAEFSFLGEELELLRRCIEDDAPVLGICLGAQLLAAAAGAAVKPMLTRDGKRRYEVGWSSLRFQHELPGAAPEPVLEGLPAQAPALHWHGDMFALPPGARLLASSDVCPNQGFRLGKRAFGLQFHCEAGVIELEKLAAHDAVYLRRANGADAVERLRKATGENAPQALAVGERLFRNIFAEMASVN